MSKIKLLKAVDKDGYTQGFFGGPHFWGDQGEMVCYYFAPTLDRGFGYEACIWEESSSIPEGFGLCPSSTFRVIEVEDTPENLI